MSDFKKCKAWQLARLANQRLYELTEEFPAYEEFGLTSQIRRASHSVMGNLAEGLGRSWPNELRRFSRYAMGSAKEIESHLFCAYDVGYISRRVFDLHAEENRLLQVAIYRLLQRIDSDSKS